MSYNYQKNKKWWWEQKLFRDAAPTPFEIPKYLERFTHFQYEKVGKVTTYSPFESSLADFCAENKDFLSKFHKKPKKGTFTEMREDNPSEGVFNHFSVKEGPSDEEPVGDEGGNVTD